MQSTLAPSQKYVLGLDIGSASLGWALIGIADNDVPTSLINAGVRIFEPGVDGSNSDIELGKDQSKAVERRTARLHRRQLRRRAARQRDLFKLLQASGLLPVGASGPSATPESRQAILTTLDRTLSFRLRATEPNDRFDQLPLYLLRKRALTEPLQPDELGRIFYHLSQRRGFKSNRKDVKKSAADDKELGQVENNINQIWKDMGSMTLGEYLSTLDPHTQKVRRNWTHRKMFEQEFARIWVAQQPHHPALLTPQLRDQIAYLLFFQRPIAKQEHLIGKCELEPNHRRAPWASLAAQRFRILQKVNDLQLVQPGKLYPPALTQAQREKLFHLLDCKDRVEFKAIRKALEIPDHLQFNLERTEKGMRGNSVRHHMLSVFGDKFDSFAPARQEEIVSTWRNAEDDEQLKQLARDRFGLDDGTAEKLTRQSAPQGYCSLSLEAIAKLMPLMLTGTSFKTAETELYGNRFSGLVPHPLLPPVRAQCRHKNPDGSLCTQPHITSLRNPAVERSLTEVRKVVNAIIRQYGKPWEIRIELARELKKPRSEREAASKNIGKNRREREEVAARIAKECGLTNPGAGDIERARLHIECGGICPYTGNSIPFANLFQDSEFDIEHIIPRSRYPDDSFQNKTLCYLPENREVKRNLTPWEAYGKDPERWAAIRTRIDNWPQKNTAKLKRFMIQSAKELEDFSARQMNDTRYTSVLAARLLESLYGGRDIVGPDGKSRQVIFASSGAVTATLRRNWGFEQILQALVPPTARHTTGKPRTDHRHHAIDAIVIALTRQRVIQSMAQASQLEPWQHGTRSWRRVPEPWQSPTFFAEVQQKITQMVVSHRPEHKLSGRIHKDSNFGEKEFIENGTTYRHIRVPLCGKKTAANPDGSFSAKKIPLIVDPAVRLAVAQKMEDLGGSLSTCEQTENWPTLKSKDGNTTFIKSVRIKMTKSKVTTAGSGAKRRYVDSGGIHHVELFATTNPKGKELWDSEVIQITEAYRRCPKVDRRNRRRNRKSVEPMISRKLNGDPAAEFLFSLMKDDTIEIEVDGKKAIHRAKKFGENKQMFFVAVNDANKDADQDSWSKYPNSLKPLKPRKVVVDLLGKVHTAND